MPDQENSDLLINALLPFVQHMLDQHGEFLPFGSIVTPTGQVEAINGIPGKEGERPEPQEMLKFLTERARGMAEEGLCKAAGLCVGVQVQQPGTGDPMDAAMAILEDEEGAIRVFLPFIKDTDGSYIYGDLMAEHAEPTIFVRDAE